MNEVIEKVT